MYDCRCCGCRLPPICSETPSTPSTASGPLVWILRDLKSEQVGATRQIVAPAVVFSPRSVRSKETGQHFSFPPKNRQFRFCYLLPRNQMLCGAARIVVGSLIGLDTSKLVVSSRFDRKGKLFLSRRSPLGRPLDERPVCFFPLAGARSRPDFIVHRPSRREGCTSTRTAFTDTGTASGCNQPKRAA